MVMEAGKSKIKELVDLVFDEVLPGSSAGKESAYNPGDPGLIPGLGRSPGHCGGPPTSALLGPCGSVKWQLPGLQSTSLSFL